MKYVFGPVPSRRLGQSLGIDTIPLKTCNWNCVYCQLGRSVPLTNEYRDYFPCSEILAQVKQSLACHRPGEIDWLTFVGSGEPTLHSGLGSLIRGVKELSDLPVAVITNGSLFYRPQVRKDLSMADAVLPSLDSGSPYLYRTINRPHPQVTFERYIGGLIAFRHLYVGKLWIEVMLIRGLNDGQEALRDIASLLVKIQPDEVHINLPTRPPAETWVQPADREALLRAQEIFSDIAHVVQPLRGRFDIGSDSSIEEAILGIITRHPMSIEEIEMSLVGWSPSTIDALLRRLEKNGRAQMIERFGVQFWSAGQARYPERSQSQATRPKG